jgi:hypothetical protein
MSLNIKNPETTKLIRELADLKGVNLTAAVTLAVRGELAREKAAQEEHKDEEDFAAWLMKISRETAPLMNDGKTSKELLDELYDEKTGLPK